MTYGLHSPVELFLKSVIYNSMLPLTSYSIAEVVGLLLIVCLWFFFEWPSWTKDPMRSEPPNPYTPNQVNKPERKKDRMNRIASDLEKLDQKLNKSRAS